MTEEEANYDCLRKSLEAGGYEAICPLEDFLSNDLTEAFISLKFWVEVGMIKKKEVRMEESNLFSLENAKQVRDILFEETFKNKKLTPCLFFMEGLVNKIAREEGVTESVRYEWKSL